MVVANKPLKQGNGYIRGLFGNPLDPLSLRSTYSYNREHVKHNGL